MFELQKDQTFKFTELIILQQISYEIMVLSNVVQSKRRVEMSSGMNSLRKITHFFLHGRKNVKTL